MKINKLINLLLCCLILLFWGCSDLNNYSSWSSMGKRFLNQNDYERAIRAFSYAITENDMNAEAYYYRGYALMKTHKFTAAIEDGKNSVNLANSYSAHLLIGISSFLVGDVENANKEFNKANEIKPNFSQSYYIQGICNYYLTENYSKAKYNFEKAMKLDPQNSNYQVAYARTLFYTDNELSSIQYLENINKTKNDDQTILVELLAMKLYSKIPDRFDISSIIDQLNHIFTPSPIKLQLLARCYALQGNFSQAKFLQKKAIENALELNDIFIDIYISQLMQSLRDYQNAVVPNGDNEQRKRLFYFNAEHPLLTCYIP